MTDFSQKKFAGAAERNREPILAKLTDLLSGYSPPVQVLEIGSGTGQHAAYVTARRDWRWQPTDADEESLRSIAAYRAEGGRNFLPEMRLDVVSGRWPEGPFEAVFSANVIHIAPWAVALALFEGASRVLAPDGVLLLYGPFRFHGAFSAPSNAAFDARLREHDAEWGVRDVDDLTSAAEARGLAGPEIHELPANNHVLAWRRR